LLRRFDQADNARVGALAGVGRSAHAKRRTDVYCAAGDPVASTALDWPCLTGQRRGINDGGPFEYHPVYRQHVSLLDQEHVAWLNFVDSNRHERAVLHPVRDPRRPCQQAHQLTAGPSAGIALEHLSARKHQPDDGTSERLAKQEGARHGEDGNNVDAWLSPQQAFAHPDDERHEGNYRGGGPHEVRCLGRPGDPQGHASSDTEQRQDQEQPVDTGHVASSIQGVLLAHAREH